MVFLARVLSAELRDDGNGQLTAPGPRGSRRHFSLHSCVCVRGNTLVCLLWARHTSKHQIHTDDSIPIATLGGGARMVSLLQLREWGQGEGAGWASVGWYDLALAKLPFLPPLLKQIQAPKCVPSACWHKATLC